MLEGREQLPKKNKDDFLKIISERGHIRGKSGLNFDEILTTAIKNKDDTVVSLLAKSGVNFDEVLTTAIKNKDDTVVSFLARCGVNINAALWNAAKEKDADLISYLRKMGADIIKALLIGSADKDETAELYLCKHFSVATWAANELLPASILCRHNSLEDIKKYLGDSERINKQNFIEEKDSDSNTLIMQAMLYRKNNFSPKKTIKKDTTWFDDAQISKLLIYYFRNKKNVIVLYPMPAPDKSNSRQDFLYDNLKQFKLEKQNRSEPYKVVQTLNINSSHWVNIVLEYEDSDKNEPKKIYYLDPLGQKISKELENILKDEALFPGAEIINDGKKLQYDGYNCGPWSIEQVRMFINDVRLDNKHNINRARLEQLHILKYDEKPKPFDFIENEADREKLEIVAFLINCGVDINEPNFFGQTPLMIAALGNMPEMVLLLLQSGAITSIQDKKGLTAHNYAQKTLNQEIPELLYLWANFSFDNKDSQDNEGKTALMHACEGGHLQQIKDLLPISRNVHVKDHAGKTALMYACEKSDRDAILFITSSSLNNSQILHSSFFDTKQAIAEIEASLNIFQEKNDQVMIEFLTMTLDEAKNLIKRAEDRKKIAENNKSPLMATCQTLVTTLGLSSGGDRYDEEIIEKEKLISTLIESETDFYRRDDKQRIALSYLLENGYLKYANLLLPHFFEKIVYFLNEFERFDFNAQEERGKEYLCELKLCNNDILIIAQFLSGDDFNFLINLWKELEAFCWPLNEEIEDALKNRHKFLFNPYEFGQFRYRDLFSEDIWPENMGNFSESSNKIKLNIDFLIEKKEIFSANSTIKNVAQAKKLFTKINFRNRGLRAEKIRLQEGNTALLLACKKEACDREIRNLVQQGADVNIKNNEGSTPLSTACLLSYLTAIDILLASKKIDKDYVISLLQEKSGFFSSEIKQKLDDYVRSADYWKETKLTPISDISAVDLAAAPLPLPLPLPEPAELAEACLSCNLENVRTLLSDQDNVNSINSQNHQDQTPLMFACMRDINNESDDQENIRIEIVWLLIEKGANVTMEDKSSNTALTYALLSGFATLAFGLAKFEPNLNIVHELCNIYQHNDDGENMIKRLIQWRLGNKTIAKAGWLGQLLQQNSDLHAMIVADKSLKELKDPGFSSAAPAEESNPFSAMLEGASDESSSQSNLPASPETEGSGRFSAGTAGFSLAGAPAPVSVTTSPSSMFSSSSSLSSSSSSSSSSSPSYRQ